MLLKSIKLENFRQFRNESIDYAQGEGGKNVTIIIGENGTGKTTFAQAFFWCLYGETEFSDKIILNKMVATEMTPGSEEKVLVTLALRHGEVDYTLIREQAYHKDYANNVKGDNTVFDIAIKDTSGNTSYVKKSQCEAEVKSILPKELSRYFFFDGERIEKMRHDYSGKDIPFIRDKTIEYLLKQKVCLCGTHLDEGSVPYEKVKSLLDVIPPKSLSTYVTDFKKESKRRAGALQDLVEQMQENLATASQQSDDIMDKTDELHKIEAKLSGKDVSEKVRAINNEIQICVKTINKCNNDRDKLNIERGGLEKERERADTERQNLTLLDEKNRKTQMYLTYARKIYEELENVYRTSEEEIRNRLQDTINDIFKQIYEGGLSLTIDSKYHITVQANDYEGDVETSTAQSISVIFAFITGIIKMARENRNASDDDAKLLSSEPYPLVMDAPLSAFDKRRIKTVCEALPETAEQVIIFIKDTDGELAEDYMGNRIGSRHQFDKKNEFETNLV